MLITLTEKYDQHWSLELMIMTNIVFDNNTMPTHSWTQNENNYTTWGKLAKRIINNLILQEIHSDVNSLLSRNKRKWGYLNIINIYTTNWHEEGL